MMHLSRTPALAAVFSAMMACSLAATVHADEPVAIFHVGNSLTDQAYGMHDIAEAKGHKTHFGRHMIPGAPLDWLWNHRDEGFRAPQANKPADEILRQSKWDVLILQPFGRDPQVSVKYAALYAAEALQGNPKCRVFVFANYPDIGKDKGEADKWEEMWLSKDHRRGRATFDAVARRLAEKLEGKAAVRIIPVGEVMYRLHQRMQDGKVPGYKHIADLYADSTHLNAEGKYLEAVTHYATVFQDDPHGSITSGLRFWKGPYEVEKEFATAVWDVAWEVVTTYPNTGVEKARSKEENQKGSRLPHN